MTAAPSIYQTLYSIYRKVETGAVPGTVKGVFAPPESPSAACPFPSQFATVQGLELHYYEAGPANGEPILFLHGNPSNGYVWRNVIPHLADRYRCLALDLAGMGLSAKAKSGDRFLDHFRYVEGFIDVLGLNNLTLVAHDWGSALAFQYHRWHPERVKAIAFLEAVLKTYPSWDEFPRAGASPQIAQLFRACRGEAGRAFLIDSATNFIDYLIRPAAGVELSQEILNRYWTPFLTAADREVVWRWPNEIPVANEPADVAALIDAYMEALAGSAIPKLLVWHANGIITGPEEVNWCRRTLRNLEDFEIRNPLPGPVHFLQECFPDELGRALARWRQNQ